jgi:hypothetical protein
MQRTEARQRINLLVNQQDYQQFSHEISSLTLHDFDDAVKTVSANPNAKYNSTIHKLIAKVQSASANVQGTRAALKHRRNDIRAYMIYFGMPAFFITINPPDIHSPYLLKIGNVNITPDILGKNYQFRANFLKNNPVLQAIYFNNLLDMFIKYILKYTPGNSNMDGILGIVRAYYGCVETQDRGSLHIHMLKWLFGTPSPSEYKEKIKLKEFREKIILYLESIIKCDFEGLVKLESEASNIHPCCRSLDYIEKDLQLEETLNKFKADALDLGEISAIHMCKPTCFKYNKNGEKICRAEFGELGKELIALSIMNEDGTIDLKRAHAFVNNFNWVMQVSLRGNHDVKSLFDKLSKSLSTVYYITNYTTKNGISSYNKVLFARLAHISIEKYNQISTESNEKCKRLLSACLNAATNNTEISAALSANMIMNKNDLGDGTYKCSHYIKTLNLFSIIKLHKSKSVQSDHKININIVLDESNINTPYIAIIHDFENRPVELKHESLYSFVSKYEKRKKSIASLSMSLKLKLKRYNFKITHVEVNTHELIELQEPFITSVLMPSVPRKNNEEEHELYAQIILTLFKSWTTFQDINNLNDWNQSLQSFLDSVSADTLKLIDNVENLKKSEDDAIEEKKTIINKKKIKPSEFVIFIYISVYLRVLLFEIRR